MPHGGGEFAVLPLFITTGLMLLASTNDFMLLFVALELVTISFYILVAYQRRSLVALEAGVKYLILGGLSSAFSRHGHRLYLRPDRHDPFRPAGTLLPASPPALGVELGLVLVLVGIGFKIAMVPFHIWAPDVYEGAPNSITAFLSVGSKAGGLVILMRGRPHRLQQRVRGRDLGAGPFRLRHPLPPARQFGCHSPAQSQAHARLFEHWPHGFILVAVIGAATVLPGQPHPQPADAAFGGLTVTVYLVTYFLATFAAFIVLAVLNRRLPGLETLTWPAFRSAHRCSPRPSRCRSSRSRACHR